MNNYTLDEQIRIVTAAAAVHGRPAARRLWRDFGLPEAGVAAKDVAEPGNLAAFVDEMIEREPGGVVFARSLYRPTRRGVLRTARRRCPRSHSGRGCPASG